MSLPTIISLSPASGPTSGNIGVTIIGNNLSSPTSVTFGGTTAVIRSSTSTSVSVTLPAHSAGLARVVVTTGAGASTQPVNFNYQAVPTPVLTSLSPANGSQSGGNTVNITGTNLLYTNAVKFGANPATSFAVLSSTQISAIAPPGASGPVSVTVTNPTDTSNGLSYVYNASVAPTVTSVSPISGPASGGNTAVVFGTGFTHATAVAFGPNTAPSFTVVSNTVLVSVVPPGPILGGPVDVLVTGPGGTSTPGVIYTYLASQPPVVTTLTPASGPELGGNTVTFTGTNLNSATAVTFGGQPASSFTVLSPTQINAVAPPGTPGPSPAVVTTPAGTSATINYTYIAAPTPSDVFPITGVTAGGDNVVITGSGLLNTSRLTFGATAAASFTVIDDTEVDAVTPPHLVGTVPISITTPGGTNSSLNFSFQPTPVVSSITPSSGPIAGGTQVFITGAGFTGALNVLFGEDVATSFTVNSDQSVTATAPPGAAGAVSVKVLNSSATSNGASFVYLDAPTLTSLSPTSGPTVGGNNVTFAGAGFSGATAVFFGSNPAVFDIIDDSQISAVAPAGSGTVSAYVVSPGGNSGSETYTYT